MNLLPDQMLCTRSEIISPNCSRTRSFPLREGAEAMNRLPDQMLCPRSQIISPNCSRTRSFSVVGEPPPAGVRCSSSAERLRGALLRVEKVLNKGDYKRALAMVKQLQGKPGGLRGFGAATQVPKRLLTGDDLMLNGRDLSFLKPLVDSVVDSIRSCIQLSSVEDEVSADAAKKIVLEEGNEYFPEEVYCMIAQHEAGHFLTGYLLGVLPKEYRLLTKGTLGQDLIAGGKVNFIGFDSLRYVPNVIVSKNDNADKRYISAKTFNNFSCVTLGGLVAEHLSFGHSEGLQSDLDKLDRVIRWWGLTEEDEEFHIRWAVTNTVFILHQHREAGLRLAEAMTSGKSISGCIETIERAISGTEI